MHPDVEKILKLVQERTGYSVTVTRSEDVSAHSIMKTASVNNPVHLIMLNPKYQHVANYLVASQCAMILIKWANPKRIPDLAVRDDEIEALARRLVPEPHIPMDGKGKLVMWQGEDRDYLAQWVRDYISKHYIFGLVHVCEAWVRLADSPNDHTLKQIIAGEMKVSEMKPEHRKEALTVSAQSRDGWSVSWIDEMIRDEKGTLKKLGKCHQHSDFQGRFGKLFG